jgi:hypothetical protein
LVSNSFPKFQKKIDFCIIAHVRKNSEGLPGDYDDPFACLESRGKYKRNFRCTINCPFFTSERLCPSRKGMRGRKEGPGRGRRREGRGG